MYRPMILYYCAVFTLFLARSAAQDYTDVQNEAGASGPSSDSVGVSSKGMIALCTIVGVVVVIGLSSTALFFVAKKRQWAMRETIRRSARQVVQAIKTPLTPRFPKVPEQLRRTQTKEDQNETRSQRLNDLEKGFKTSNSSNCSVQITAGKQSQGNEKKTRGWGSRFAFNRS
ncbi:uncharacterized protein P174DRAFT_440020 [Aspergillus novofumigatus IBT 16806]|uniref:Transmembrane protein n=1 Tax=Aspergillus novofumigatus (strain IBT 16806) TaxID=1392255 RepID=A0A2I1CCT3_ASPN1|nr:uncharacterized protein P174DRAFT_440020 [Aspergillus novofumigatus IBT 16806]PKX95443.1 hypothetical protein P174DRAFT_440020 [Aspergillus novofumigatus IBT 16806]